MNIIVADDHQLIVDSLLQALQNRFSEHKITGVEDKKNLLYQLSIQKTDVLLLDIHFGNDFAGDFLPEILQEFPHLKVAILSSENKPFIVSQFLNHDIEGFIHKSESLNKIEEAVSQIIDGQKYFSEIIKKEEDAKNNIDLTPREIEVLQEILLEKPTKLIASDLKISEKTVEMHRNNLFVKFDVNNVAGLVKKAYQEGFFS